MNEGGASPAPVLLHFPVQVPADPRWFDAHFPGQPIVPGVVLLATLEAGCRAACGADGMLRAVRHLRFLVPVQAPLTLLASVSVRGDWLHCTLAVPAPCGDGPATDVLRAQLRFEAFRLGEGSATP